MAKLWLKVSLASVLILGCFACSSEDETEVAPEPVVQAEAYPLAFEKIVIDADAQGPAFSTVTDINGDGKLDVVVTRFGVVQLPDLPKGQVTAYLQGETLEDWTATPIFDQSAGIYWPNDVEMHDIDGDGDLDALVGAGFLACEFVPSVGPCGSLTWFEQMGTSRKMHEIVPMGSELFYHAAVLTDLDGDGLDDLVTVGERRPAPDSGEPDRAEIQWFKGNTTETRFETTPGVIGEGLGGLLNGRDLNGDGLMDFAASEFFANMGASFTWLEQLEAPSADAPNGLWQRHIIDDEVGPSIQMSFVENLLGDGRLFAVGSNHTNTAKTPADPWESAIYMYEVPADPNATWERTKISEYIESVPGLPTSPQAAPGIFGWGDAEMDGDIDIIVSGDGDPNIYLLAQDDGAFTTWVLDKDIPQAGGQKIIDLNNDGKSELIVTGYENNAVYLYHAAEGGPYPLGLAAPKQEPEVGPSDVVFELSYEGDATGDLVVALFETYPPVGPPSAFTQIPAVEYPATATLPMVAPGNYTAMLVQDTPPLDFMTQGPEDLITTVELSVPLEVSPIQVELNGESQGEVGSSADPADVTVVVNYEGGELGQVILAVFDELPPAGPPKSFKAVDAALFPLTVTLNAVSGGTAQILAFLDLEPFNMQMPDATDPQVSSQPFEVNGEPVSVELTLE